MRHHLLLVTSLLVSGCGNNPPGAGTAGHVCRHGWLGWSGWCDEGLGCIDNVCTSCGHDGEFCCNDDNYQCLDGMACDTGADADGTCTAGCGSIGSSCCSGDDPCPSSGTCTDGKCDSGGVDESCFSGSESYVVYIVAANCVYTSITLKTDTSQDAEDCRQQIIDGGGGNIEVSDLNGAPPTMTDVCRNGDGFAYHLSHYSDGQLAACEALACSNCSWTLADNGTCP